MRAFADAHPEIVHAEVNVSDAESQAISSQHRIRAVPSYRLLDPATTRVLFEQNGGSPDHEALNAEIQKWEAAKGSAPGS